MKLQEKRITLWLPKKTHVEIKKYSRKNKISVSEGIRRAIITLIHN